jgi:hypothetical protein
LASLGSIASPDLSQIVAVEIVSLILHGAIHVFQKKRAIDATGEIRHSNRADNGWQ